ncbi:MAG: dioxygenase [Proteobacteria bacterium]|nr:dioxygenase [Pseudomonadota bacterium]
MRQPTLYIPHGGGPCFFMDWTPAGAWDELAAYLRGIVPSLPETPRAVLVISAHWEERLPTLMTHRSPPMLFDYSGFPPHTYKLSWPAPGAPELAEVVAAHFASAGIEVGRDPKRGFDHGVFVPLLLALPDATVPTLQLSLKQGLDPEQHLAIGRALAPLRDEGVLIVGSGSSYHNMRGFGRAMADSKAFDDWLADAVTAPAEERNSVLARWSTAPKARACHPREEHLLPLHVCAGAAGEDAGRIDFNGEVMGVKMSAVRFG